MKKILLPVVGLLSSAMWASPSSAADDVYYETRICGDCSYSQALAIAKTLEPQKNCFLDGNGGPEQQSCYSITNKVLVVNSVTRAMYGFYNGHDNQGMSDMDLVNFVRDIGTIPEQARYLANGILDTYEALHQVAAELTEEINAVPGNYSNSFKPAKNRLGILADSNTNQCADSKEAKAVEAAFSLSTRSNLRMRAQQKLANNPNLATHFKSSDVTGINFGFGGGGLTLGGSWIIQPKSQYIYNRFETDVPNGGSQSEFTQVVYTLSLDKHGLDIELNEVQTFFAGINIKDMKNVPAKASEISFCLGEALDKAFKKTVSPSSSGSGGGSGSGSTGGGLNPRFGNIPVTSGSGSFGGGGGGGTCDHHYYHKGQLIATIAGPCP
ncbi:hypothetical protein [Thalassomonas sp. RHCl1]|uniref:hypothetical protein n=1 Tax=Thalassomonas sp. RHCl1 TaxID=2995320 RepID=UPI00248AFE1D|nr:hypothetical protein [Thalassomonas sp. RHCl1]